MNNSGIMVSVYCLAYNHGKYIRDALEGFVNQKTNFEYEVIVHDDASTDDTAQIIKEYASKYPKIIKPIFQKENQYSKNIEIVNDIIIPRLTGKYVSSCEGDDYWCDCNKLQKQVDFLEKNDDYSACVHNTKMFNVKNNKFKVMYEELDRDLELENIIYRGGQSYQTSSLMCRKDYFVDRNIYFNIIKDVGDYPLSISLKEKGKIHFFRDVMSVYRVGVAGSWSTNLTRETCIKVYYQSIELLQVASKRFPNLYKDVFEKAICHFEYEIKLAERDFSVLKDNKYRIFYKQETVINKIKIQIKKLLSFVCEKR